MLVVLLFVVAFAQYDPHRFKSFLLQNRMKQCAALPSQPRLPRSYNVPPTYFDSVPLNQRVPPGTHTEPRVVAECNHQLIQPAALDAYTFETERFISTIGLNIYDGSLWTMAVALLGEIGEAENYETGLLKPGKTCQFGNIRADTQCRGVIVRGACHDPDHTGYCGFCYGDGPNQTMSQPNAWTFKSISDYWSLEGTVDLRCPELKHTWVWNDYKPVMGENAWANIAAPLQIAYMKYNGIQGIPANDISLVLALSMFPSLSVMIVPSAYGAIGYAPKNTFLTPTFDLGFEVSLENNLSLLGGMKMLKKILTTKNIYPEYIPIIDRHISAIETFAREAYSPSLGYFRQGGIVQLDGSFQWATGASEFAVDCQTWTMSQLGPKLINQWFGAGTAEAIWKKTKELGGYHYNSVTHEVDGLGFSINSNDQVYSGEWTFGAVNMLRIFAVELNQPSFNDEATRLRHLVELRLTEDTTLDGVKCRQIKYSNKRYYIPFGWWANPVGSMASTAWAVFLDSNWNPLHLGGAYSSSY